MSVSRSGLVLAVALLLLSTRCPAQKADAAFVVGGSFVSDSTATFGPAPTFIGTVQADHHIFLEGNLGLQLLNAKLASVSLELPFAGIPSQALHLSTAPSTVFAHMSALYVTPGFRLKLLPGSPLAPFVSVGGGLAHYSLASGATNKGALDFAGGVDFKTGIPHLAVRGEVRDFITGDPNFNLAVPLGVTVTGAQSGLHRHNILAGGGVILRY